MAMFLRSRLHRFRRLILVSLTLGGLVAAVLLALAWAGPRIQQKATLGVLIAMEITYVGASAVLGCGAAISGVRLWWAHRTRTNWRGPARGLLLCVSSLITLGLAELLSGLGQSGTTAASEPAHVAALPPPSALSGDRGATEPSREREVTIAVLGESSAAGVPFERWLSVGKIVGWQLEQVIPGQSCRVETLAEPGATLEGQHEKLSRVRHYIDALIVYCGHNEFAATIPSSRRLAYYVDEKPSLVERIDDLLARVSPLCRLIRQSADRIRAGLLPQSGLRPPLVDGPACTDAERAMRLAEFRQHLDAIVVHCKLKGTLAILVVPPANDAGFDPNRSFLAAETTREAREAFAREFLTARGLEATDPARAQERYRSLLQAQPGFAETHYRLGRLLKNAGAWDEAYDHFVRARDCDGMPIRCLSSFQDVYREVAVRRGCPLVDGQALFHSLGAHGLLDDQLFMDAMHPSLTGQVALAQGILDAIRERGALDWPKKTPVPKIDLAQCAAHFGLGASEWRLVAERGFIFETGTALFRYDQSEREAKIAALHEAIKRLAEGEAPENVGMPNLGVRSVGAGRAAHEPR